MKSLVTLLAGFLLLFSALPARSATPWMWDRNADGIDDRIDDVEARGLIAAERRGDPARPLRFDVTRAGGVFAYGIYILYDEKPTADDQQALETLLGKPVKRYQYIDYIRTRATRAEMVRILRLPGVDRIEVVPYMFAVNDNATKSLRAAGSNYELFPSVTDDLGITGRGVVIAILDTGVNDAPDSATGYPGHESLIGKWVGGGDFSRVDPLLNTPLDGSMNPVDRSPDLSHGSHVAGSAMGTGGPTGIVTDGNYGFYRGMAPDARLVDCKVLTDAGTGLGTADGLEWCIYHKDDDWGLTGDDAIYRGIQVLNLSLGGDASDGTDANSQAVNAAVRAGLVVCVSTGNDGEIRGISSPSAADLALSIGAAIDYNTLNRGDDAVADFSNEGPRLSDADADSVDEMKPSVCPPGAGITSVQGTLPLASGTSYTTVNGTSMSCPIASGLCALIIQGCPGITPQKVREILQDTADHLKVGGQQAPGAEPGYQAIDPNYHPSWGWGSPNAYAAVMEARFPNRTQVIREWADVVAGGIDIGWTTQREVGVTGFRILRADPIYGSRGPFQEVTASPVAPAGDPFIHKDGNRTSYLYQDRDPNLVPGEIYWYRVRWTDTQGQAHDEPALPVIYDPPTPIATLYWSITHNTPDNDLLIFLGSGTDLSDPVHTAEYLIPGPGSGAADSVVTVPGTAELGTRQHFWHLTLTDQDFGASQSLPPSALNPWFLSVNEAGYLNRAGRVEFFRIVYHDPGGDVTFDALNPPTQTVETATTTFWIPSDPALATNRAPVIDPIGNREALEGRTLEFTVTGHDPDGDNLTWSAPALPPGATFNPATRVFSWSPGYDAVTTTSLFTAEFQVVDDALVTPLHDIETIEIRLHDIDPAGNLPPYWNPTNDQSAIAGTTLTFSVSAVDPEGSALTYSAQGLPAGATFNTGTRVFTWDTPGNLSNDYLITFKVNDGTHPDVDDEVIVSVKSGPPPLIGTCESTVSVHPGNSAVGSSDLGTADSDTIAISLPRTAIRLATSLTWTGGQAVDLDYYLYDANGNEVGNAASLSHPESFIVDNLPAGDYSLVVIGYLVPVSTDWVATVDACLVPATSAAPIEGPKRATFALAQNFPNPFRASGTRIRWHLPEASRVKLHVMDVRGALVRTLVDGEAGRGDHEISWDGRDNKGQRSAAGLYFYRLEVPGRYVETRRMIRLQ